MVNLLAELGPLTVVLRKIPQFVTLKVWNIVKIVRFAGFDHRIMRKHICWPALRIAQGKVGPYRRGVAFKRLPSATLVRAPGISKNRQRLFTALTSVAARREGLTSDEPLPIPVNWVVRYPQLQVKCSFSVWKPTPST